MKCSKTVRADTCMQISALICGESSAAAGDAPAQPEPPAWQAQYVKLLIQQSFLGSGLRRLLPEELVAGSAAAAERARGSARAAAQLDKDIRAMERDHQVAHAWVEGSLEFEAGFAALCSHEIEQLQVKITAEVQMLMLLEILFKKVASRRKDTKRLLKKKEEQSKKIKPLVNLWVGWKAAAERASSGAAGADEDPSARGSSVPAADAAVPAVAEPAPQALFKRICGGDYPWLPVEASGTAGKEEFLRCNLLLQTDNHNRANEEMDLVQKEAMQAGAAIDEQKRRIARWMQASAWLLTPCWWNKEAAVLVYIAAVSMKIHLNSPLILLMSLTRHVLIICKAPCRVGIGEQFTVMQATPLVEQDVNGGAVATSSASSASPSETWAAAVKRHEEQQKGAHVRGFHMLLRAREELLDMLKAKLEVCIPLPGEGRPELSDGLLQGDGLEAIAEHPGWATGHVPGGPDDVYDVAEGIGFDSLADVAELF